MGYRVPRMAIPRLGGCWYCLQPIYQCYMIIYIPRRCCNVSSHHFLHLRRQMAAPLFPQLRRDASTELVSRRSHGTHLRSHHRISGGIRDLALDICCTPIFGSQKKIFKVRSLGFLADLAKQSPTTVCLDRDSQRLALATLQK
ncbi:hypothetical protein LIA77_03185 [Sarocladium implicatum]|nr:hypothetical protein LIA77_03185 [Sarocladium implicatum]